MAFGSVELQAVRRSAVGARSNRLRTVFIQPPEVRTNAQIEYYFDRPRAIDVT
jgi:hypothetical protein